VHTSEAPYLWFEEWAHCGGGGEGRAHCGRGFRDGLRVHNAGEAHSESQQEISPVCIENPFEAAVDVPYYFVVQTSVEGCALPRVGQCPGGAGRFVSSLGPGAQITWSMG
jgi:hypothetical protein